MRKLILAGVFILSFIACPMRKELLVPALLDYELYYPDEAREQGLQGTVYVRVFVDENGRATNVRIDKSSGNALLDSSALRTAQTFVFSKAMRGNKPMKSWVLVPIEFKLKIVHPDFWLTEVKILQQMIAHNDKKYIKEWINELYSRYKELIYSPNTNNDLEVNQFIKQAVLDTTANLWQGFWEHYPATILLFIDIINRYPDSFTSLEATADFNNYFNNEKLKMKNIITGSRTDSLINRLRSAVNE